LASVSVMVVPLSGLIPLIGHGRAPVKVPR
jgi:hypothetical protein